MIPLIFLFALLFGGANAALVKYAGAKISPIDLVFFRSVLAAICVLPFVGRQEFKKVKINAKVLAIAGILFACNVITFAYGIQRTSVLMGQLIYVPTSLIVGLFGYFLLGEKLSKKEISGLILTFLGLGYLLLGSFNTNDVLSFGTPLGNILIIFGLLSWSSYLLITRKISDRLKPQTIIFFDFIISAILSSPFFIGDAHNLSLQTFSTSLILAIFAVSIVSSVIFFFLNQWIIKNSSAFMASLMLYPTTLSAVIYGVIFFHEKLEISLIIGAVAIIAGIFMSSLDSLKLK